MSETYDADVIIAGAGMTGATLALALASAGLKSILIDPQDFKVQIAPEYDGRSSAIAWSTFRQWLEIGVGEALVPNAQRIEQILVTDAQTPGAAAAGGLGLFLRFDAEEIASVSAGEPLGYMIENRHSRAALAQAVTAAGITVLAPARVSAVSADGGAAVVTLEDGRVLRAPLCVGAEGRACRCGQEVSFSPRPRRGARSWQAVVARLRKAN